jgi:hypothetical protein
MSSQTDTGHAPFIEIDSTLETPLNKNSTKNSSMFAPTCLVDLETLKRIHHFSAFLLENFCN